LAGRVVFAGWIEHDLAPLHIATADAIVNPYRDTLINRSKCSIKVIEAMALGKAVITSRVGESLQYIEDGRSGLLTEPGDVGDLARALLRVLSDREWATELGRNARLRAWQRYDWDVQATEVERAYEIASGRTGASG
jgi:glycosyltransferase involved in cell wall biosynthesis